MSSDVKILADFEAADFLRLKLSKLLRMAKAGEIPRIELPDGQFRFLLSDLVAYVQSKRIPSAHEGQEAARG